MSGALGGALGVVGLGVVEMILMKPPRMLGYVIPDVTIEERHSDRLQVTQHPVELGANISDHAFMLPFELSLRYGWSGSSSFGGPLYVQEIYQQLLFLQKSRIPFDIITGKRVYQNMLLLAIETPTDSHTEEVLMVELHCQQVIIVSTSSTPATPTSAQAQPAQTAGDLPTGQQQPVAVTGNPGIVGLSDASPGIPAS
jgi:hypothetical protein